MNIIIKPLSLDLTAEYLDFFDNRAFPDDNPNGPCYCNAAIMDSASLKQMVSEFGDDCKGTLRRYAVKQLAEEKIFGYLAFDGGARNGMNGGGGAGEGDGGAGAAIGWCNAGDMDAYVVNDMPFVPDFARQNAIGKTMSVVCFAIAPEYRGKGVALALLERVVSDAKAGGYVAVEGYAREQKERNCYDYEGPVQLYEKAGFKKAARSGDKITMRKKLRNVISRGG